VFGGREPPQCLLIGTSRRPSPEALRDLVASASESNPNGVELVELHLSGLSDEEASELARRVAPPEANVDSSIRDITAEARRNPFFVLALSRNAVPTSEAGGSHPSLMRRWVKPRPGPPGGPLQHVAVAVRPVAEAVARAAAAGPRAGGNRDRGRPLAALGAPLHRRLAHAISARRVLPRSDTRGGARRNRRAGRAEAARSARARDRKQRRRGRRTARDALSRCGRRRKG